MSRFGPILWEETAEAESLENEAEVPPWLDAKLEASLRWLKSLGTKLWPETEICARPVYTALLPNEIRLLQLQDDPKRHGIPICSFTHVSLEDLDAYPFFAIPYTWNEREYSWYGYPIPKTAQVFLDDAIVEIPGHVAHILGMLSLRGFTRIWIDFLCINQADNVEKGQQVAKMGQIYSSALEVVIVLGKPTPETDRALSTFSSDKSQAVSGADIMNHSYWRRAWIFQEIVLAKRLRILCDHQLLDPQSSTACMSKLSNMLKHPHTVYPLTITAILYIKWTRNRDVLEILRNTSHCQCSDPRDALYSKLSLISEAETIGDPDYTITVNDLYIRFAIRHIQTTGTLFILNYIYGSKRNPHLPSWVPDWRPDDAAEFGELIEELQDFDLYKSGVFDNVGQKRSDYRPQEDTLPRTNATTLELVVEGVVLNRTSALPGLPWKQNDPSWEEPLPLVENFLACCLRDGMHGIVVVLGQMDDFYVLLNLEAHPQFLNWALDVDPCTESNSKRIQTLNIR